MEKVVLRSPALQEFVVSRHERAVSRLIRGDDGVRRVGVVGGGLFPRSVIVLRRVVPEAEIVVIDGDARHVEVARRWVGEGVEFVNEWYEPARHGGFDLVVVPLAYDGNREAIYDDPPARRVLVHDWIWRRRGRGAVVSVALLKRLNLVEG
jgi:hypothetical protein